MAPESRDEVRQRIDSLYDQAENATGNFNATRAMAARSRSRGVPLAKRRGGRPDPGLDEVARQWFDAARAKLGPTVPAALPADRLPAGPAAQAHSRNRTRGGLPGGERGALALPGGERDVPALPGGERAALEPGPSGLRPELEQGADRAIGELTAGSAANPASRSLAALESGRATQPGAWNPEPPRPAIELAGPGMAEPGGRGTPGPAHPGPAGLQPVGARGPLGLTAPMAAPGFPAPGALGSAPEAPGPGGLRSPAGLPGLGTAGPAAEGLAETAVLPVAALPAAQAASVQVPRALPGSAASVRPAPAVSKAGNRRKLTTARGLLSRHTARLTPSGTAQPVPAQTAWDTGAQQVVTQPATAQAMQVGQMGQVPDQWERQWAAPGGSGSATAAATTPATPMTNTGATAPMTDTGSFTYPAPASVTDTGSFTYPAPASLADTGSFTYPTTPAPATDTGSFTYPAPASLTDTGSFRYPAPASLADTGSFTYPTTPAPATATDTGSFTYVGAADVPGAGSSPSPLTGTGSFASAGAATGSVTLPSTVSESPRALRAAKAIAFARAQIGKPCVWGATGPDSYDCSSLTQAAWRAAGVTLPRAAHQQALSGAPVTPADLEPGDLVLFFDDDRHVGLHIGDGMMVHAPGPGSSIREESVYGAGEAAIHRVVRPA